MVKDISKFIAKLNSDPEQYVGYCGLDPKEIQSSIEKFDLPAERAFSIIERDGVISGALGFDVDLERMHAEVWGPFIESENWIQEAQILWANSLKQLPTDLRAFDFFYETKNTQAINFATHLGAKEKLTHSILSLKSTSNPKLNHVRATEIRESLYSSFIRLHDSLFPNAYLSGQQILRKINEDNKVFVIEEDTQNLIGYIYVEVEPAFLESTIHFFGVHDKYRGKGFGKQLLHIGTHWIFTSNQIKELSLCVDTKNSNAINLYQKAGFIELHRCINLGINME